ncbi:MAG: hypothetical protein ABIB43_03195 [archaeon]
MGKPTKHEKEVNEFHIKEHKNLVNTIYNLLEQTGKYSEIGKETPFEYIRDDSLKMPGDHDVYGIREIYGEKTAFIFQIKSLFEEDHKFIENYDKALEQLAKDEKFLREDQGIEKFVKFVVYLDHSDLGYKVEAVSQQEIDEVFEINQYKI